MRLVCLLLVIPLCWATPQNTRLRRQSLDLNAPHGTCIAGSPGASFRDGCNWCVCVRGRGGCTKVGCSPAVLRDLSGTPNCRGVISWIDKCNICTCDPATGFGACTKRNCVDSSFRGRRSLGDSKPSNATSSSVGDSKPSNTTSSVDDYSGPVSVACQEQSRGSWWMHACNYCRCVKGKSLCSQRKCTEGMALIDTAECEGEVQWTKDKCTTCRCHRGSIVCTTKPCGNDLSLAPGKV